MDINEYFVKMKNIEEKILNFLDQEDQEEENYENFIKTINDEKIRTNKHDLKTILYLIIKISNNHRRLPNFHDKIDQMLKSMREEIKNFFSNFEIFKIFKTNKRILLFLLEEKILLIDESIYKEMIDIKYQKMNYPEYFSHEIKSFIEKDDNASNLYKKVKKYLKEDYDKFNEKRKKGENNGYLYELIQNDNIEEFIIYVNKESYSLNSNIENSIFETNQLLLKQKKIKLIEYAAFFGSIQIFRYLYKNDVLIEDYLLNYAIHGCDEEIIHIIEENCPYLSLELIKQNCEESIKCHHNFITNYIEENLLKTNNFDDDFCSYCFKYYNFLYIDLENSSYKKNFLHCACKYDYYRVVVFLLNEVDFNKTIIYILFSSK